MSRLRVLLIFSLGLGLCSCFSEREEPGHESVRSALYSTSAELMDLGFDRQALDLLIQGREASLDLDRVMDLVRLHEKERGPGVANGCLERFFPGSGSREVKGCLIDDFLRGWKWEKAAVLLQGSGEDPRLLRVRDILSRTRRVREPFGRTQALNWRNNGWVKKRSLQNLSLSIPDEAASSSERFEFFTPVGWNGGGFRQAMEIRMERFEKGAHLIWGLTANSDLESAFGDARNPFFMIDYSEGRIRLRCSGFGNDASRRCERRWYWPRFRWLRLVLEYVPDVSFYDASEPKGRVRAWLEECSGGFRLLTLEAAPLSHLDEQRMLAGFFGMRDETSAGKRMALRVDNFTFDN